MGVAAGTFSCLGRVPFRLSLLCPLLPSSPTPVLAGRAASWVQAAATAQSASPLRAASLQKEAGWHAVLFCGPISCNEGRRTSDFCWNSFPLQKPAFPRRNLKGWLGSTRISSLL